MKCQHISRSVQTLQLVRFLQEASIALERYILVVFLKYLHSKPIMGRIVHTVKMYVYDGMHQSG